MGGGAESLLGFRLRHRLVGPYDYPWDVPRARMPAPLKTTITRAPSAPTARALSIVYYNMLLTEKARVAGGDFADEKTEFVRELQFWWTHGRRWILRWNLDMFAELVRADAVERRFFGAAQRLIRSASHSRALCESKRFRSLIKEREHTKRRTKCRLCGRPEHRRYLNQWKSPQGRREEAFQLDYRHQTGDTITRDILRAQYRSRPDVPGLTNARVFVTSCCRDMAIG